MPKTIGWCILLSAIVLPVCFSQVHDTSPEKLTTFRVMVCDTRSRGPMPCTIFGFRSLTDAWVFVVSAPSPFDLPSNPLILRKGPLATAGEAKHLTSRFVRAITAMLSRIEKDAGQETITLTWGAPRFHFSVVHGQTVIQGSFDPSVRSDKCSEDNDALECLYSYILRRLDFGSEELRQFEAQ